jgi:hypothetical protein
MRMSGADVRKCRSLAGVLAAVAKMLRAAVISFFNLHHVIE